MWTPPDKKNRDSAQSRIVVVKKLEYVLHCDNRRPPWNSLPSAFTIIANREHIYKEISDAYRTGWMSDVVWYRAG